MILHSPRQSALLSARATRNVVALLSIIALLVGAAPADAAPLFVKTPGNGGNNANDGLSWDTAKATIGGAMAVVTANSTISVAAGTYNEKVSFPQINNVQLLGGFPAAGGAPRDIAANPTVIDGTSLGSSGPLVNVPIVTGGTLGLDGIVIDGFTKIGRASCRERV